MWGNYVYHARQLQSHFSLKVYMIHLSAHLDFVLLVVTAHQAKLKELAYIIVGQCW